MRVVAERWMADFIAGRKPTTIRNYRSALDGYILPVIGNVPMAEVDQADAVRLHESLRRTPVHANRVLAALSSLLGWSMKGNGRYQPVAVHDLQVKEARPRSIVSRAREVVTVRDESQERGPESVFHLYLGRGHGTPDAGRCHGRAILDGLADAGVAGCGRGPAVQGRRGAVSRESGVGRSR